MIPTNPGLVAILLIGAKLVLESWLLTNNELNEWINRSIDK
jgi:hypothetical protein